MNQNIWVVLFEYVNVPRDRLVQRWADSLLGYDPAADAQGLCQVLAAAAMQHESEKNSLFSQLPVSICVSLFRDELQFLMRNAGHKKREFQTDPPSGSNGTYSPQKNHEVPV
jgi:hypothetical protein